MVNRIQNKRTSGQSASITSCPFSTGTPSSCTVPRSTYPRNTNIAKGYMSNLSFLSSRAKRKPHPCPPNHANKPTLVILRLRRVHMLASFQRSYANQLKEARMVRLTAPRRPPKTCGRRMISLVFCLRVTISCGIG